MVFSSPLFLFFFLPVVLTLSLFLRRTWLKNWWLLAVSVVFYAWGETTFVLLVLASTGMNFLFGRWIHAQSTRRGRKWALAAAVALNVGLLAFFKYANFLVGNVNWLLAALGLAPLHLASVRLPIGISFFTFHALSYVIDVYRGNAKPARRPAEAGLYIFFFPQLIAGPILRWSVMAPQIASRWLTRAGFAEGVRRFVYGLSKKVLLANTLAVPADQVFGMAPNALSPLLAWTGAVCYALQIYFDFSGYSDMAIGLGKMFGFDFIENFRHPYTAQSLRDFWRRWHISLSTWFRDYLYFPLGGNRCPPARNHVNLLIVFLLCGLWHGASWTFVVWGLYHGLFLVLERTRWGDRLSALPRVLRHVYAVLVILFGWVIFRSDNLPRAFLFLRAMLGLSHATTTSQMVDLVFTTEVAAAGYVGLVFSTPVASWFHEQWLSATPRAWHAPVQLTRSMLEPVLLTSLLVVCAAWLANGTYNPFIYFRF